METDEPVVETDFAELHLNAKMKVKNQGICFKGWQGCLNQLQMITHRLF